MCGRYTLTRHDRIVEVIPNITISMDLGVEVPRWNIAPSQEVLAATNREPPALVKLRWGLVPSWAKDPSVGNRMINARAETLAEKPAFRRSLERRRCLVWADGFYEWKKSADGRTKTPMYIRLRSHDVLAFAGLWDTWNTPDGRMLQSCTIITTAANDLMRPIHDRMPVIVPRDGYADWLDPHVRTAADMTAWLRPYPAEQMEAYAVGRRVNSPGNEGPELIVPAPEGANEAGGTTGGPKRRPAPPEEEGLFGPMGPRNSQ